MRQPSQHGYIGDIAEVSSLPTQPLRSFPSIRRRGRGSPRPALLQRGAEWFAAGMEVAFD